MTLGTLFRLGLLAGGCALVGCERQISYTDDVQPILAEACIVCHSQQAEGEMVSGLRLDSYADLMQGTHYGQVVVAGSAMSSALYLTVAGKTGPEIQMPPHHEESWADGEGTPLTDDQVDTIQLWIDQGAKNN